MNKRPRTHKKRVTTKIQKKEKQLDERVLILALILVIIVVIFSLERLSNETISKTTVLEKLENPNSEVGFLSADQIDKVKLDQILNKDYSEIKNEFAKDVIIYFEDENGNLVPYNGNNCIAHPDFEVEGFNC